jgi:hypothetical protein
MLYKRDTILLSRLSFTFALHSFRPTVTLSCIIQITAILHPTSSVVVVVVVVVGVVGLLMTKNQCNFVRLFCCLDILFILFIINRRHHHHHHLHHHHHRR